MSEFCRWVVREANIYFNGAVASHTVLFPDGSEEDPGDYATG